MTRRALLRRTLLAGAVSFGAGLIVGCSHSGAAPRPSHSRIGFLSAAVQNAPSEAIAAFKTALLDYGYVEGQNIDVDWVFVGDHDQARIDAAARDLVRRGADLIVCPGQLAMRAAMRASDSIPLVMATVVDPVQNGFVTDLMRPGGRVTGFSGNVPGLAEKRLQILTQVVPKGGPIGVLYNPSDSASQQDWQAANAAATALQVQLARIEVIDMSDYSNGRVTSDLQALKPAALLVFGADTIIDFGVNRREVLQWAMAHRVPGMYFYRKWAVEGGLMTYGPSEEDLYRQSVSYVDKILRGQSRAELPIEQPATLEFVVSRLMLKAFGLTLPDDLASTVTEWVD